MTTEELLQKLQQPPQIHPSAFVAPNATAIGDVIVNQDASLWFGAVLRGDTDTITVGARTNIQDNAVIHADPGAPCNIGVLGTPAKVVKTLGPEVETQIQNNVDEYVLRAKAYKKFFAE